MPERYASIRIIRRRGGLAMRACRRVDDGAMRVVIAGDDDASPAQVGDQLDRIEQAHRAVASPHIAAVEARGERGRGDYLALCSDALLDLEEVSELLFASHRKVSYAIGIAVNEFLMDAVEAVHAAPVEPGAPRLCLGALCLASVACGPTGRMWLFGIGENFLARPARAPLHTSPGVAQAPEVSLGMSPSPASDVFALHAMIRALLPLAEPLPLFRDALDAPRGSATPAMYEALAALSRDLLSDWASWGASAKRAAGHGVSGA